MKKEIEVDLFMQPSARTPIMYIDGNSRKSLEEKLKEILKSEIPIIITHETPWHGINDWKKDGYNPVKIKPKTTLAPINDIKQVAKKVKITIEVL